MLFGGFLSTPTASLGDSVLLLLSVSLRWEASSEGIFPKIGSSVMPEGRGWNPGGASISLSSSTSSLE
ncbi:hypothetical protein Tco_1127106 [Tanacetum coccineum]